MPPNTKYVGRGSKWGNQFVVGVDGTTEECIRKYIDYWLPYQHTGPNSDITSFLVSQAALESIKTELKGYNLACWCKIGEPCHADFLLKTANED